MLSELIAMLVRLNFREGQPGGVSGLYEDMLTVSTRGGPVQKFPKALSTRGY